MRARGFTLVELVLVIVLMGILAAISLPMLMGGFNAFSQQRETSAIEREAMLALERIAREVRMSSNFALTASSVAFDRPEGDRVEISFGAEIEISAGTASVLARNLVGFDPPELIEEGDACYLRVAFTTEPNLPWRQLVYLRNVSSC